MSRTLSQVLFQRTIDKQYEPFNEFENLIDRAHSSGVHGK